jgi:hypothetical protein
MNCPNCRTHEVITQMVKVEEPQTVGEDLNTIKLSVICPLCGTENTAYFACQYLSY